MPQLAPAFSTAAERNKDPILEVLRHTLPVSARVIEIAAGTGQHAEWFCSHMPGWDWQPTDGDPAALEAMTTRVAQDGLPGLRPPRPLDVMAEDWLGANTGSTGSADATNFDAVYCANMLHIAPWPVCGALMRGATRHLAPQGVLVTYGPYLEDGIPTAPGNLHFDTALRARDPACGIRQLADVAREAQKAGLALQQRHAMPANNLLLVFARAPTKTR